MTIERFFSTQELIQSKERHSTFYDNSLLDSLMEKGVSLGAIGLWMQIHAFGKCTRKDLHKTDHVSPKEVDRLIEECLKNELLAMEVSQ